MSISAKEFLDRIDLTMAVHIADFNGNKKPMQPSIRGGRKGTENEVYGLITPTWVCR
jgi:hypothetical protein